MTVEASPFQLPFRLELFGGKDATKAAFDEGELRTQLFDFEDPSRTFRKVTVHYYILGTRIEQEFSIPEGLAFDWTGSTTYSFVTGESKQDYQNSLSKEMGLGGEGTYAGIGFGLEVNDSFGESTLEETYEKYVSSYERIATYNTHFVDKSPAAVTKWLSGSAVAIFATKDPKQIVDTFGTHYMTEATFGGVQRFSSKCSIIDSTVKTSLSEALGFKLQFDGEGAGGEVKGSVKDASETTRKIYNNLGEVSKVTFGGLPDDKSMPWATTLLENPTLITSSLGRLDELIIDDPTLKAAVAHEIDARLKATRVSSKLAVAYWADFGGATNDAGSHADDDISVAGMNNREGWWSVGQYAISKSNWDPLGKKGIMIRADDRDLILPAAGTIQKFGMSSPTELGVFAMDPPKPAKDGSLYYALSDHFAREDDPGQISFENAGCVNAKLLVKAAYGKQIWTDHGTHANDSCSIWAVVPEHPIGPIDYDAPQLFKAFNNYDGPNGAAGTVPDVWLLDMSKIIVVKPLFMDELDATVVG